MILQFFNFCFSLTINTFFLYLADGKRVVCIPERKNATAILHKCQKSDSGTYLCKIKNDAGVVEVPLQVQVLGEFLYTAVESHELRQVQKRC